MYYFEIPSYYSFLLGGVPTSMLLLKAVQFNHIWHLTRAVTVSFLPLDFIL